MWAAALLDELARAGVREVVLAPGYRSAPLVMAAAADARLRVFTHLDERSAAFFALGVGKRARRPAAVITTSGTAVANLLPAVVEASYSEAPLLLLTADRPHRLRGADANQAIDQAGIFGRHVRDFVEAAPPEAEEATLVHLRALAARAVASSLGRPAGPVHLNLPFAKPLAPTRVPGDVPDGFAAAHPLAARGRPEEAPLTRIAVRRSAPPAGHLAELAARVREVDRGLIVAGPSPEPERDGPAAKALAAATGYPLLADALSGARFGDAGGALRIGGYDLFLGDAPTREALRPELVLRLGASPTSANLLSLLEEAGGEQWVIDAGDRWKDHLNVASDYLRADVAAFAEALCAAMARRVRARGWRGGLDGRGAGARRFSQRVEGEVVTPSGAGRRRPPRARSRRPRRANCSRAPCVRRWCAPRHPAAPSSCRRACRCVTWTPSPSPAGSRFWFTATAEPAASTASCRRQRASQPAERARCSPSSATWRSSTT